MLRYLLAAGLVSGAAAEKMLSAGQLSLTWTDCGASHGKTDSIQPSSITLGTATKIIGKGSVNVDVLSGTYELKVNAGFVPLLDHNGDVCKSDTIALPLGIGTIEWMGLQCPQKAGPAEVDMLLTLSSSIPESAARTTITLKAKSAADDLLCVQIKTAPAYSLASASSLALSAWSYMQYVTRVDWSMDQEDRVTYTSTKLSGLLAGANVTTDLNGYPPYYMFQESGTHHPYWQYPQYVYHQGFNMSALNSCQMELGKILT